MEKLRCKTFNSPKFTQLLCRTASVLASDISYTYYLSLCYCVGLTELLRAQRDHTFYGKEFCRQDSSLISEM